MAQITILLPHGEVDDERSRLAPRDGSLAGKKVGFLDNELWRSMHILTDELAKTPQSLCFFKVFTFIGLDGTIQDRRMVLSVDGHGHLVPTQITLIAGCRDLEQRVGQGDAQFRLSENALQRQLIACTDLIGEPKQLSKRVRTRAQPPGGQARPERRSRGRPRRSRPAGLRPAARAQLGTVRITFFDAIR